MDPSVTFPENWKPPRELSRALPREASMAARGIAIAVVSVLLVAGSIPIFLWLRNQQLQKQSRTEALHRDGRESIAEINRLWNSGRSDVPMVEYSFSANGVWMRGESSVPKKVWPSLQKAGTIPVRYLPSNPAINHPSAWDEVREAEWLALVAPFLLASCGVFLLVMLRRQAVLAAEGLPSAGVVTRCFRVKGGYRVRYQY